MSAGKGWQGLIFWISAEGEMPEFVGLKGD